MIQMQKANPAVVLLTVLLLISCLVPIFSAEKATTSTKTITVPDDFPTIHAAVENASAGDTVFVKAGTYNITEHGYISFYSFVCLSINKPISLIGENCQNTIIIATGNYLLPFNVGIMVRADGVYISGFTIISNWQVVSLSGNNNILTNNIIRQIGNSVAIGAANGAVVSSNIIEGAGHGDGVFMGSKSEISNNSICNFDVGLTSYDYDFNQSIVDNTIANNSIGLKGLTVPALFYGNNILNCSQYSISLGTSENVNATFNYWGTSDQSVIENLIYDHKNDPSLGIVNFTPFLTEPNYQTSSNQNPSAPIGYLSGIVITIVIALIFISLIVIYRGYHRKS